MYQSLTQAANSGVPILEAIDLLAAEGTLEQEIAFALKARLRRGGSLATAMSHHPGLFPGWQVEIVRMGEATGRMELALAAVSDILETRRLFWLGLLARLATPVFLLHLAPLILEAPLWASAGFDAYWRVVLGALVRMDLLLLALCLSWPWVKDSALLDRFWRFDAKHRFLVCLSALFRAGVSLDEAVAISCAAAGRPRPQEGGSKEAFVDRLARIGVFSGEELGLLRVAEFSGTLDTALGHLADRARQDWVSALKKA
ncbi:MAG: type II secretion system F family protein [Elusimicrobia bacterium]|nr:type II secretion system F family protein [Elusimicrobiota bacterium]